MYVYLQGFRISKTMIKKKKKVKKMVNRIPKFAIGSAKNNPPPAVG